MKSISSSIVVLVGMYGTLNSIPMLVMQTSFIPLTGFTAGLVTLALGLVGWWQALKHDR